MVLPVVVHIVGSNPSSITDQMVIDSIQDLNNAFSHKGRYASSGPGFDTKIEFRLAQQDPGGGNTTGITRTVSILGDVDADTEDPKLKALVSWDTKRYINIYIVTAVQNEVETLFYCGEWIRLKERGKASAQAKGNYLDGVVSTGFGYVLAHNLGHFLSLRHTFTPLECHNKDCRTEGDGVCDTPPSSVYKTENCSDVNKVVNSCTNDTESGLTSDLPDLLTNFMTLNECTFMFTNGQGEKMRAHVYSVLPDLRDSRVWLPACPSGPKSASFTRSLWEALPGQSVTFEYNGGGSGLNFNWKVNGADAGSGQQLTRAFASPGRYAVTLRVHSGDPSCYASQTDTVIVAPCAVMARFVPEKRVIAAREPILIDNVVLKNRSVNGTSFRWLMRSSLQPVEKEVGTARDLDYTFRDSGVYQIRLVATNGSCSDTSAPFLLQVKDPTIEGSIFLRNVRCESDKYISLEFVLCNGLTYSSILEGTPISFYNGDPSLPTTRKIGPTHLLKRSEVVTGTCCGTWNSIKFEPGIPHVDEVWAVFNDKGNLPPPFTFVERPGVNANAAHPEKNFTNNYAFVRGVAHRAAIDPAAPILSPGEVKTFTGKPGKDAVASGWLPNANLTCTNCLTTQYTVPAKRDSIQFFSVDPLGCRDTAKVSVEPFLRDDYKVRLDSMECNDTTRLVVDFTVQNMFAAGAIPKDLKVSFFSKSPDIAVAADRLGPVFTVPSAQAKPNAAFRLLLPKPSSGKVYAVVNDSLPRSDVSGVAKAQLELDFANNADSTSDRTFKASVSPTVSVLVPGQALNLNADPGFKAARFGWLPNTGLSCTGCLNPTYTSAGTNDTLRFFSVNRYSCTDTAASIVSIPPFNDYTLSIDSVECHPDGYVVDFSLSNAFIGGVLPKGLKVSFFDTDPSNPNVKPAGSVFMTSSQTTGSTASYRHVIASRPPARVFALVNDTSARSAVSSTDPVHLEKEYGNNAASIAYNPFSSRATPVSAASTPGALVVFTGTPGYKAVSNSWLPKPGLSCTACLSTQFTVSSMDDTLRFVSVNRHGCRDTSEALVFVPPYNDYVILMDSLECHPPAGMMADFRVRNLYGSGTVPVGLRVSFFGSDPSDPSARPIAPVFTVPAASSGQEAAFRVSIPGQRPQRLFAVVNDTLPRSGAVGGSYPIEKNYANNSGSLPYTGFSVSVNPATVSLQPGDRVGLTAVSGYKATQYGWFANAGLSCTNCLQPAYTAGLAGETLRFGASNRYGCTDSARVEVSIPPYHDFTVDLEMVECYRPDSLIATFSICNDFKRGYIPKGLKVIFMDGPPSLPSSRRLGEVYLSPGTPPLSGTLPFCLSGMTHVFKAPAAAIRIYAIVNDNTSQSAVPTGDTVFLETNRANNIDFFDFQPNRLVVTPTDTTVFRQEPVTLKILSSYGDPASIQWRPSQGLAASCLVGCPETIVSPGVTGHVDVQMRNRYGCFLTEKVGIKVVPPDMTLQITDSRCFTNGKTRLDFSICMGNRYDTVPKGVPVSFYDGDPQAGTPRLLESTFVTLSPAVATSGTGRGCASYFHIVSTPASGKVFAYVNQKASVRIPDTLIAETDITNNRSVAEAGQFTVLLSPLDTLINRTETVRFRADTRGGKVKEVLWSPASMLSCSNCLQPTAIVPYTQRFTLVARNEFDCRSEVTALVRTEAPQGKYFLPTAFTPNKDGKNDYFYVIGSKDVRTVVDFSIYDRYGQRVFQSANKPPNDPLHGWDGTRDGKPVTSGSYVYIIVVELVDGSRESLKGLVSLIR